VAITYEKSAATAAEVVRTIEELGRRAVAIPADSADAAAVQASVERTVAELGGLDILVNNAGILRLSEVKDISLEDIDATLNVNVRAPIIASKAAIPHLGQGGRVINVGSFFADRVPGGAGLPVYALSKSALSAFTKGLARELGPRDITVNVVQPGSIDTDMPAHGPFGETLRSLPPSGGPADGSPESGASEFPYGGLIVHGGATGGCHRQDCYIACPCLRHARKRTSNPS